MADTQLTRQQIYDRIRQSSKDEFILSEMKRLGFWPSDQPAPSLPELLIKKESELQKELRKLLEERRLYENKEAVLKEMRQKRMEAAKRKREETKEKREEQRRVKAAAWKLRKEKDIIYLGEGVSAGLNHDENNNELLEKNGLPVYNNIEELATAIGISIAELRFLSFHRNVSRINHYKRFYIRKKSGGKRLISAPMPRLKGLQYWILDNLLNKIRVHDSAHGFIRQRSIISNAILHLDKEVVVNIDLKDFFPSIRFKRVKGLFRSFGYAEKLASVFALVCTEPEMEEVQLDGTRYFVAKGERKVPQGAPTSPAITNILCYRLDCRFKGMAAALGFTYTRYADDMSFSAGAGAVQKVQQLLWRVRKIVQEEGFTVHPDKIRVMRKGARQEVTGIVVNKQPGINRKTLHRFRALLHQIEKDGFENKKWKGGNIVSEIQGYANYIFMVKPALGNRLKAKVKAIVAKYAVNKHPGV